MRKKILFYALAILLFIAPPATAKTGIPSALDRGVAFIKNKNYESAISTLRKLESKGDKRLESNKTFLIGEALLKLGRVDEAENSFYGVLQDPLVGDWAYSHLSKIKAEKKEYEEVAKLGKEFRKSFAFSPLREEMARVHADALLKRGNIKTALELLQKEMRAGVKKKADFLFEIAYLQKLNRQPKEAYKNYQQIYYQYPADALSYKAVWQMSQLENQEGAGLLKADSSMKLGRLQKLMNKRKYNDALSYISQLKRKGVSSKILAKLDFKKAVATEQSGKKREAIKLYKDIIKRDSYTSYRPLSLYRLARRYWNLGENKNAKNTLGRLISEYPQHAKTSMAYYITARIAEGQKKYTHALVNYSKAIREFPRTEAGEMSLWSEGWLYYRQGRYLKAEQTFKRYTKKYRYSESLPKAIYWQARSLGKLKRSNKELYQRLKNNFPYSYYTILVQNDLPNLHKRSKQISKMSAKKFELLVKYRQMRYAIPFAKSGQLFGKKKWFKESAINWIKLGFNKRAKPLITNLENGLPDTEENLMFILNLRRLARDYQGIMKNFWKVTGNQLKNKKAKTLSALLMFPIPYWEKVVEKGAEEEIDPMLIMSIMRQESGFNHEISSQANARGLLQIIPTTGENISKALKIKNYSVDMLYDPSTNIAMGTFYLSYLLDYMKNDIVDAVASYNAGKESVKKWQKRFSTKDKIEFIEEIPYPETRGYVKKVLRNYGIYREMYNQLLKDEKTIL